MEELIQKLADILEVDELDINKKFTDYEDWNSLVALSVIAMIDEEYDVTLKGNDITGAKTIEDLFNTVQSKL